MTDWVRLWHDMPTDPKWRVVARKSGQPLACVLAVFSIMLTNASANAAERGTLLAWDHEDVAAALDMEPEQVEAIHAAMQGKVLDGDRLSGWDRRQPKREDDSTKRVAKHRAEKKRDVTQGNAPEKETEEDTEESPPTPPAGGSKGKSVMPEDWVVPTVAELPPQAKACAEQWTAASYATHAEAFVSFWRSNGRMMRDWRLTWANRIIDLHAKVMSAQRFGNDPKGGGSSGAGMSEADQAAYLAKLAKKPWAGATAQSQPERRNGRSTGPPRPIGELVKRAADVSG